MSVQPENKACLSPMKPHEFDISRLVYSSRSKQTADGNYAVNVSYELDQITKAPVLLETPRMTLRKNAFSSADGSSSLVPVIDLVLDAKKSAVHAAFSRVLFDVDVRNVEEAHAKSSKWFGGKVIPKDLIADYCKASLSPLNGSLFSFRASVSAPVLKRSASAVKVFSSKGKELSPDVLVAGMDVSLILELPCLFCRKVTLGSLWKVVQMKVHPKTSTARDDAICEQRYAFSDMPGDDSDSDDELNVETVSVSAAKKASNGPNSSKPAVDINETHSSVNSLEKKGRKADKKSGAEDLAPVSVEDGSESDSDAVHDLSDSKEIIVVGAKKLEQVPDSNGDSGATTGVDLPGLF
jgi:Family of unknown function (DUF5871)